MRRRRAGRRPVRAIERSPIAALPGVPDRRTPVRDRLPVIAGGVLAAGAGVAIAVAVLRARRDPPIATVQIVDPDPSTTVTASGGVKSVQAADLTLPERELEAIWTPMHLERLARTYWRFLSHATLGIIRIQYADTERRVVIIGRPLVVLRFHPPEYELDAGEGRVRWRIRDGWLVSRRDQGHLQIDVNRRPGGAPGEVIVRVQVEVSNFYPAIAERISRWVYAETQSRIHVIVTHGFLRSLARLDLVESRIGAYARPQFLSEPPSDEETVIPSGESAPDA
jgi:hypothetical protein